MIDKRIRFQVGGGADMSTEPSSTGKGRDRDFQQRGASKSDYARTSQSNRPSSNESNRPNPQRDSGQSIDTYITPDQVKASREFKRQQDEQRSSTGGGLNTLAKTALNFLIPGSSFINNQGIQNTLGDFRQKFTGYRTQAEYDAARQQRRNLDRIRTIQNTLNRKYADGDYSNTNLDERLAGLQSLMGIVPNDASSLRSDLDFSNELAEATQATPQENEFNYMYNINDIASLINNAGQSQMPQDLDQIGEGADFVSYDKLKNMGLTEGPGDGTNPQLGELTSFIDPLATMTAKERELKNYFDSPIQSQEGIMGIDGVPTDLEIFYKRFP